MPLCMLVRPSWQWPFRSDDVPRTDVHHFFGAEHFQPYPPSADPDNDNWDLPHPPANNERTLPGIEPDYAIAWFHFSARNSECE